MIINLQYFLKIEFTYLDLESDCDVEVHNSSKFFNLFGNESNEINKFCDDLML